jgi:protein-disulfide isomerase
MHRYLTLLPLLVAAGCAGAAPEAPAPAVSTGPLAVPDCDALGGAQLDRARQLLGASYIHDCCDRPLAACLEQQPRCRLAVRLAANVCRRVAAGEDDQQIERALALRARMAQSAQIDPAVTIDLDGAPRVGGEAAPVTIVVYAGPRGTHCARLTPLIHQAVVDGPLQGKARLFLKPFPLRSNPHSKEAGLAFVAARQLGKLWEFVLHSYARFDQFTPELQPEWAATVGIDRAEFERLVAAPETKEQLSASKLEGLENGVESTPSVFLDGRYYQGELEIEELVDTVLELHDRSQGLIHVE